MMGFVVQSVVLRCVIPVVLSNKKNKLNGIYVCRHKHNYILCSMFTITRHNYMFWLVIFRLYMRNLSISYTNVCGEFTVCGVGWVRDLVLCC